MVYTPNEDNRKYDYGGADVQQRIQLAKANMSFERNKFNYVGLTKRGTAFTLDSVIALFFFAVGYKFFIGGEMADLLLDGGFWSAFCVFFTIFCTIPEALDSIRATPGKFIMGMQVITRSGDNIGFIRSIIRNILKMVEAIVGVTLLLGFVSPKKRTLHDIIAGTYVVENE